MERSLYLNKQEYTMGRSGKTVPDQVPELRV